MASIVLWGYGEDVGSYVPSNSMRGTGDSELRLLV